MSHALDGLQFPLDPKSQKPSSSKVGKEIIAEALSLVDNKTSMAVLAEKNWRKHYPHYFKALVKAAITQPEHAITIAQQGLQKASNSLDFYRHGERYSLKDAVKLNAQVLHSVEIRGQSTQAPTWSVPYQGQNLQGDALLAQLQVWQDQGIIEPSHADAMRLCVTHPEWFDLSDRTMVLFGAGSEAGPLTWLAQWKANIVALDLPQPKVWQRIIQTIQAGNATLYAPSHREISADAADVTDHLGANLLTEIPEIVQWLSDNPNDLDLAAIAYLDGEKHVRVAMAMDSIMHAVSQAKAKTSLMFMCTPTDVYAVPPEVIRASKDKFNERSKLQQKLSKAMSVLTRQYLFKANDHQLIPPNNGQAYGISDCLVIEQGPNYALAKRLQQWRATLARSQGQVVSINIAPSTTTQSVVKNPLLKAAFDGASLFDVEAFAPETTNALMAALWIHDLRNPQSVAQPTTPLQHPLELMMSGANHGGLWRAAYLARTALPFAAVYGMALNKLPKPWLKKLPKIK
ncbi:hypothetical protein [uncultured Acinetobacter sp.]|uniref:hypothetical protein n=1 Tax=uncultured Acinetobacter sp. TaxID=165433 RepID=UPI00262517A4|nr:hypothetical protein [uncultured Acinetobacter sp.]